MASFPRRKCLFICWRVFLLSLIDEGNALKGLGHHWLATVTLNMTLISRHLLHLTCSYWYRFSHLNTLVVLSLCERVRGQSGRRNHHPSPLLFRPSKHKMPWKFTVLLPALELLMLSTITKSFGLMEAFRSKALAQILELLWDEVWT